MRIVVHISFGEAFVGDVGRLLTVPGRMGIGRVEKDASNFFALRYLDGKLEYPDRVEPMELLHREYPKGKTADDVQSDIDAVIKDMWLGRLSADAGRAKLTQLFMVLELGKPFNEQAEFNRSQAEANKAWVIARFGPIGD